MRWNLDGAGHGRLLALRFACDVLHRRLPRGAGLLRMQLRCSSGHRECMVRGEEWLRHGCDGGLRRYRRNGAEHGLSNAHRVHGMENRVHLPGCRRISAHCPGGSAIAALRPRRRRTRTLRSRNERRRTSCRDARGERHVLRASTQKPEAVGNRRFLPSSRRHRNGHAAPGGVFRERRIQRYHGRHLHVGDIRGHHRHESGSQACSPTRWGS